MHFLWLRLVKACAQGFGHVKYLGGECSLQIIDFLIANEKRNNYIKNLTVSLEGNTLLLFSRVEKHGKPLYNSIKEKTDKKVFFVAGEVETKAREEIRKLVARETDSIIVASMGTFSTM